MKRTIPFLLVGTLSLAAQTSTNIGGRSTGVSPGMKPSVARTIESTAVMKLGAPRTWKSADGREIAAELVSWPIANVQAAQKDPQSAAFDVVRNGVIRLRKEGKTFALALDKLSAEDQAYVKQVIAAVSKTQAAPK
jgi:hypothetical protein